MATQMEKVRALSAGMKSLNEADKRFATSLLNGFQKYGNFTDKQMFWVDKLITRAANGGVEATTTETVGDLAGVYALFTTAKAHLKHPAIVLGYQRGHETRELRINVAGERASKPGSLNVKDEEDGTWYGRVHQDGTFEHSRRDAPPSGLTQVLRAFAADPAGVAGAHGHLTGKCCFCNRPLTDERSTAVGYGKICADHYGMPWGAKAAKSAQLELAPVGDNWMPDPELDQVIRDRMEDTAGEEEFDRAEARAVAGAYGRSF